MVEKQPTLWPLGILLIIASGIVLIVISVRISSKQSIDTDRTFDMKRLELNENINLVMQQQNIFENLYNVRISTMRKDIAAPIMKNPYYVTPVPRIAPESEGLLQSVDGAITLYFEKKENAIATDDVQNLHITSVELELVRLNRGEKEVSVWAVPMLKGEENVYVSSPFSLPMQGYYQARFKIVVEIQNPAQERKFSVYFYHWIFNQKKDALQT